MAYLDSIEEPTDSVGGKTGNHRSIFGI